MMIIGCDFHTRYQQIAMLDESTGELIERRLDHESGEAHTFYRDLQGPVRVGIEATGPIHWAGGASFEAGLNFRVAHAQAFRAWGLSKRASVMWWFYEIRSSNNAVLKHDGGFASQDAAKMAAREDARKMKAVPRLERQDVGRILVGQNAQKPRRC